MNMHQAGLGLVAYVGDAIPPWRLRNRHWLAVRRLHGPVPRLEATAILENITFLKLVRPGKLEQSASALKEYIYQTNIPEVSPST